jgi:hypothetical protein
MIPLSQQNKMYVEPQHDLKTSIGLASTIKVQEIPAEKETSYVYYHDDVATRDLLTGQASH